jgi:hypothetical protein
VARIGRAPRLTMATKDIRQFEIRPQHVRPSLRRCIPPRRPGGPSYRVVRNRQACVKRAADPPRPRARRKSRPGIRPPVRPRGPRPSRHPTEPPPDRSAAPEPSRPPEPPVTPPPPDARGHDRAGAGPAAPGCRGSGRAGDGAGASAVSRGPRTSRRPTRHPGARVRSPAAQPPTPAAAPRASLGFGLEMLIASIRPRSLCQK